MNVASHVHSSAPLASLTAGSNGSTGGAAVLVIALIVVIAAVGIVALLRSSADTAGPTDKPAGSLPFYALIVLALGILWFAYIPWSGPI
jgi:hypothetical protein